jgi:hypothetical protein
MHHNAIREGDWPGARIAPRPDLVMSRSLPRLSAVMQAETGQPSGWHDIRDRAGTGESRCSRGDRYCRSHLGIALLRLRRN